MMALKVDKSFTTENYTFWVTVLAWTGNTMSSKDIVVALLNPNNIHLGFSKAAGRNLIYLKADICKRSVELPGSIKTLLTLNLLIPSVRIKVFSCGCKTRLGFTRRKVIISSTSRALPLGKLCWMELTCSLTEAARSNLCLFGLELYFSSMGPL